MANFTTVNNFTTDCLLGNHIVGTHTFKWMLSAVAPVATNAVKTDITEIASGNGYSAGGPTTTVTKSLTGGSTKLLASSVTVTATGAVPSFRYEILYNSTTNKLIGWQDHGSTVTLASTDTHTIDGHLGVLTLG